MVLYMIDGLARGRWKGNDVKVVTDLIVAYAVMPGILGKLARKSKRAAEIIARKLGFMWDTPELNQIAKEIDEAIVAGARNASRVGKELEKIHNDLDAMVVGDIVAFSFDDSCNVSVDDIGGLDETVEEAIERFGIDDLRDDDLKNDALKKNLIDHLDDAVSDFYWHEIGRDCPSELGIESKYPYIDLLLDRNPLGEIFPSIEVWVKEYGLDI